MTDETKVEEVKIDESVPKKAVFYTDGGCQQSLAIGGWGFHGYVYAEIEPKRGSGCPGHTPTAKGYLAKADKKAHVTVLKYVDGHGSITSEATNNVAELVAFIKALDYILLHKINEVHFLLDSEYVLKGVREYIAKWKAKDWKRGDGLEVKNLSFWKRIDELLTEAKEANIILTYDWVKGHSGNPGNNQADLLATKGSIVGQKKINQTVVADGEPLGYWNYKAEYSRMFGSNRLMFYSHVKQTQKNKYGYYPYYLYDPPAQAEMEVFGTAATDCCFSIIYLHDFNEVIEQMYKLQDELDYAKLGSVVAMRLDNVFKPRVFTEIMDSGHLYLYTGKKRCDILTVDNTNLTEEIRPPRRAYHGMAHYDVLERILQEFIEKGETEFITVTDITPIIYEEKASSKKKELKISSKIDMSAKHVDIDINHNLTGEVKPFKSRMIFGIDLPKRNVLSAVSDSNPEVKVITWRQADTVFHFATVLKTDDGIGIWANVYNNHRFLNSQ